MVVWIVRFINSCLGCFNAGEFEITLIDFFWMIRISLTLDYPMQLAFTEILWIKKISEKVISFLDTFFKGHCISRLRK